MKKITLSLLSLLVLFFTGCNSSKNELSVAVFVPGIIQDNACYSMLVNGVNQAVQTYNATNPEKKAAISIMEAGNNQSEWASQLTLLASSKKYKVIISSNPSLPDIVEPLTKQFPKTKFILLDASHKENNNIYSICYNQYEQSYLTGYIAGLMSKTHKLALIAAQEYPVMNNIILPYFEKGAKDADVNSNVSFLVIGNWFDANKASIIADTAINDGVDVILPICGGASQGVINSAVNNNAYITWFDDNGFSKAPGTIISSTIMAQDKMAELVTTAFLNDLIPWGKSEMVGMKDGFIKFIQDDDLYIKTVPEEIRNKIQTKIQELTENELITNTTPLSINK